jgi:hypothetical protein
MSTSKFICAAAFTQVFLLGYAQLGNSPNQGDPQPAPAAVVAPATSPRNIDEVIDRVIANENTLRERLKTMHPLLETYIQEMKADQELESIPKTDAYFLGKLDFSNGISDKSFLPAPGFAHRALSMFAPLFSISFYPKGFADMIMMDPSGLNRDNYKFEFVKREFLGDVRCIVLNINPKEHAGSDRFIGRIWVEDEGYNVVRFNGTYTGAPMGRFYAHFDSWRINSGANLWLPACIYTEDAAAGYINLKATHFKGQTRLWGYQSNADKTTEAFTNLMVESPEGVDDKSDPAADTSPVEAQRLWERQAEDNVLDRLQKASLISPAGDVDKVLETVLNNLAVTNNIAVIPEIRARVMLTTPLECIALGHTVLISRGLLDVLPDEASLAAVLAHELAHIALGHKLDTQFAFTDRLLFDDTKVLRKVSFGRTRQEEETADQKALEILKNSPYKDQLPQIGLFLRLLTLRSNQLPHLIHPLLGIRMAQKGKVVELSALVADAPQLRMKATDQIAARQLGARIKVDPWSNQLRLLKTRNVALQGPREKMPFEITPFMLHLTRINQPEEVVSGSAANGQPQGQAESPAGTAPPPQ